MKSKTSKIPSRGVLRVNVYAVLSDCVEEGIGRGLNRADKHAVDPLTEEQRARLLDIVENTVMAAICEKFDFPDYE